MDRKDPMTMRMVWIGNRDGKNCMSGFQEMPEPFPVGNSRTSDTAIKNFWNKHIDGNIKHYEERLMLPGYPRWEIKKYKNPSGSWRIFLRYRDPETPKLDVITAIFLSVNFRSMHLGSTGEMNFTVIRKALESTDFKLGDRV